MPTIEDAWRGRRAELYEEVLVALHTVADTEWKPGPTPSGERHDEALTAARAWSPRVALYAPEPVGRSLAAALASAQRWIERCSQARSPRELVVVEAAGEFRAAVAELRHAMRADLDILNPGHNADDRPPIEEA
uniref:hypothetical protein n=1 Tax=Pseudonocardia sp. CA-138482 TaxID=3240023 RepID=UPI003F49AA4B